MITWEDRVRPVRLLGFTDRQANFLVTVMLHAGLCVRRQYEAFAGLPHGRAIREFFDRLVADGYATSRRCGHPRSRVFHLHHKRLYRAIGEENNRYRRPTTIGRAIERLMLLDGVLGDRSLRWLATEGDKVAYFTLHHRIAPYDLPSLIFRGDDSETVRHFPDKLPIGLHEDGRTHVFLYLVIRDVPVDFRAFLERHAELWRRLPAWTLRLLVPRHKTDAVPLYERAFHEHVASPLRLSLVDDLRWYFQARQDARGHVGERFEQAVVAFRAPRFQTLYRAWLERGEPVLDGTLSASLADALTHGTGALESRVLPYDYGHFYGLVSTA